MLDPTINRRKFVALGMGAVAVGALPAAAWLRRRQVVRRQVPVMGTLADLIVVHRNESAGQAAVDAAIAELRWVERMMTRFDDASDIGRTNLEGTRRAVAVDPATSHVVAEGLRWAEGTDGRFDPGLGIISRTWEVESRTTPPSDEELNALNTSTALAPYQRIDAGAGYLRLADAAVALDLGGIAKGYAVDRAADALRSHGVASGMVNVGGDLYAIGTSPDGDAWNVGIRNPFDPETVLATTPLSDGAVATSGDYLRFFEYGGHRYHHLIDPFTGAPRETRVKSLTVQAETCMTADAAATAAFGLGHSEAQGLVSGIREDARVVRII